MIQFVSAFLGLVSGVHPVTLAVEPTVAAVELRLDGAAVGVLSAEPWTLDCDFGARLEPHELVALARDAAGREIARSVLWVNVDRPTAAQDGALTAVLVEVEEGFEPRGPAQMRSWFLHRGRALEVERVEKGDAEMVFVRDPAARRSLAAAADIFYAEAYARLRELIKDQRVTRLDDDQRNQWVDLDPRQLPAHQASAVEMAQKRLRSFAALGPGTAVRFVSPFAAPPSRVETGRVIFHRSRRHAAGEGGLLWLTHSVPSVLSHFRLADAVAVAARQLHGSGRRRAVLVVLGQEWTDESLYGVSRVLAYLSQLQVPVTVWSTAPKGTYSDWGEVVDLGAANRSARGWRTALDLAAGELRQRLESQRVVWLRGSYLLQSIELAEEARGIRLLGRPDD